jgi:hypothetical protein
LVARYSQGGDLGNLLEVLYAPHLQLARAVVNHLVLNRFGAKETFDIDLHAHQHQKNELTKINFNPTGFRTTAIYIYVL